jgi:hypothetical protein
MFDLTDTKHLKFIPLSQISTELERPIGEVIEALIRFNLEGDKFKTFLRFFDQELEVDSWADDTGRRIKRVEAEYFHTKSLYVAEAVAKAKSKGITGNQVIERLRQKANKKAESLYSELLQTTNTEMYSGFLELQLKEVDTLIREKSLKIQDLLSNGDDYVALKSPMTIKPKDLYILNTDYPAFIERYTCSTIPVFSTELVNLIHSEFGSDSNTLIATLERLQKKRAQLEEELYWAKEASKDEKATAKDRLIAGLIAVLVEKANSDRGDSYLKANAKLEVTKIEADVIKRLNLDRNMSGISDFRNLISSSYKKHSKSMQKAD